MAFRNATTMFIIRIYTYCRRRTLFVTFKVMFSVFMMRFLQATIQLRDIHVYVYVPSVYMVFLTVCVPGLYGLFNCVCPRFAWFV